ncbi:hypothetical protein BDK51DRAFT_31358, partial [Blyttiomyces helicus]
MFSHPSPPRGATRGMGREENGMKFQVTDFTCFWTLIDQRMAGLPGCPGETEFGQREGNREGAGSSDVLDVFGTTFSDHRRYLLGIKSLDYHRRQANESGTRERRRRSPPSGDAFIQTSSRSPALPFLRDPGLLNLTLNFRAVSNMVVIICLASALMVVTFNGADDTVNESMTEGGECDFGLIGTFADGFFGNSLAFSHGHSSFGCDGSCGDSKLVLSQTFAISSIEQTADPWSQTAHSISHLTAAPPQTNTLNTPQVFEMTYGCFNMTEEMQQTPSIYDYIQSLATNHTSSLMDFPVALYDIAAAQDRRSSYIGAAV